MSEEQVARVYAQALFDAAREAKVVEPVRRELGDFVAALAASASLRKVLSDPQLETSAKTRVLAEITRGGQQLLANALQLMLERRRFAAVTELRSAYDALAIVEEGVVEVEVVSAAELSPETEKKIAARIKEATGRRVETGPARRPLHPRRPRPAHRRRHRRRQRQSTDPPAAPQAGYRRSER